MGICRCLIQLATSPVPLNCDIVIPLNISFLSGRLVAPSLLRKSILRKAFDFGTLDMAIDCCVYGGGTVFSYVRSED